MQLLAYMQHTWETLAVCINATRITSRTLLSCQASMIQQKTKNTE